MKFLRPFLASLVTLTVMAVMLVYSPPISAQTPATGSIPDWQKAAGGKAAFDVTSVKLNPASGAWHSNIGLTEESNVRATGNLFSATDVPMNLYIAFAYKVSARQSLLMRSQLPKWALTERFDIEAKAPTQSPTKDEIRLMMQALLMDRFKLAAHQETRQAPIYKLVLDKPGKTGPNLQPVSTATPCAEAVDANPSKPSAAGSVPPTCGMLTPLSPSAPGRLRMGVRNANMEQIAGYLGILGALDREVLDGTGLQGNFDFSIEWTPEPTGPLPPNFQPDPSGPPFLDAVREQLGIKLVPQTGPADFFVIDHVEEPSPN